MLSSSNTAVPETPVFKTGLVRVLFVKVSVVDVPIIVTVLVGRVIVILPL